MWRSFTCYVLLIACCIVHASAATVSGYVKSRDDGTVVPGAFVRIVGTRFITTTDGNGFFLFHKIPAGHYTLVTEADEFTADSLSFSVNNMQAVTLTVLLNVLRTDMDAVTVTREIDPTAGGRARLLEKNSIPLVNIISRQAIAQSADMTVADVAQRVSGVSVIRDQTGVANKAIIRGMDPKYGATTVNGLAIPSPDDRSRYIPLDLFPSVSIDHIEVYKSLTPDMEGNAIGGALNIVTRQAPVTPLFSVQLSAGYSQLFLQRSFLSFNSNAVQYKSPYELHGASYQAKGDDFSKSNLSFNHKHAWPNLQGNITWGRRFLKNRLGVIAYVGAQDFKHGSNSFLITQNNEPQPGNIPGITDFTKREYSAASISKNGYMQVDYIFNKRNRLRMSQFFIHKKDIESRSAIDTSLSEGRSGVGTGRIGLYQRSRVHLQNIYHINLHGSHQLGKNIFNDWTAAYSYAFGSYPDWAELSANTGRIKGANGVITQTPVLLAPLNRIWLHNKEKEKDIYWNLHYKPPVGGKSIELVGGTLLRFRQRDNFYNNYVFNPAITSGNGQPFTDIYQAQWLNNNGPQNPLGAVNTAGTYSAKENILAFFGEGNIQWKKIGFAAGVREENTLQHVASAAGPGVMYSKDVVISYHDWLPSVHLKYSISEMQNIRLSYFKAISRPALYDITFFNMDYDDYNIAGNPFLKRSRADNIDLRYEIYAPALTDALQVSAFYKMIADPFEKTLLNAGDTLYALPQQGISYIPASKLTEQLKNFGVAYNYGLELSAVKKLGNISITGNYTLTFSRIVQRKKMKIRTNENDPASDIVTVTRDEKRPLQGQSMHLANMAVAYTLLHTGWICQAAITYTGRRIEDVSGWYGLDNWRKGYATLDFSIEKKIGIKWKVFAKATNLLNTSAITYIRQKDAAAKRGIPGQTANDRMIMEKENNFGAAMIGVRYGVH